MPNLLHGITASIAASGAMAFHYGYAPAGHYHPQVYNQQADPWALSTATKAVAATTTVDKTNWYSPYQQYSPIRIPYVPAKHNDTIYASCIVPQTYNTDTIIHKLQFAQRGGKATMSRITVQDNTTYTASAAGGPDGASTNAPNFQFRILEYGRLDDGATLTGTTTNTSLGGRDCTGQSGDEFNPLLETDKMGRANPYQDPSRGRIPNLALQGDASQTTGGVVDSINKNVLVNLSGPDSIIGRAVAIYEYREVLTAGVRSISSGPDAKNCCIIALDKPPTELEETHHHHGFGTAGHSHTGDYAGHTHSGYAAPTYGYTYPGGATTNPAYHAHGVYGTAQHSTGIHSPGTSGVLYAPHAAHGHYRAY